MNSQSDNAPPESGELADADDSATESEGDESTYRERIERDLDELKEFVQTLTADDLASGSWFTKLLAAALDNYTEKVDWQYFLDKYEGVPADAIVDQRIKMASRYAAIEGGLSASAYTLALAATLGPRGGRSPAALPAAAATMMVDVVYLSRLQIRLAYDISVLYRVPLDMSDPDDLWTLIKVAFTIKSGEFLREVVNKAVPGLVRPVIKRYYARATLAAARGIPYIGRYLLQSTVMKVVIPAVGVPVAVLLNRSTTRIAGEHAREVFRNEARVIEVASNLTKRTQHPSLLGWVAWAAVLADGNISDDEALLMRHLVRQLREHHQVADQELAHLVELDRSEVWQRIEDTAGDLSDLFSAAAQVVRIDGEPNSPERAVLAELADLCNRDEKTGATAPAASSQPPTRGPSIALEGTCGE